MSKNDKSGRTNLIFYIFVAVAILICSTFGFGGFFIEENQINNPEISEQSEQLYNGNLTLTMIDCGQADSFLFEQNGAIALVDCGTTSTGKDVVEYLKEKNISHLDYVFATHPHDDHMGGMFDIITNFEVTNSVIPKVKKGQVTSKWYLQLMTELVKQNHNIIYPKIGETYKLGEAIISVIGPIEEEPENLNNYSIILKISYGEMDILMTGDAEKKVEKDLIEAGTDLDVEILKIGHHGSDTSTSTEFLDATTPDYALISCKVGNKYNHPNESTLKELQKRNIKVFRTDENGNVTLIITANNINCDSNYGDYVSGEKLERSLK